MSLDIPKLKLKQDEINARSLQEIYEELPSSLLQLVRNSILNYCLEEVKSAKKDTYSARVLHNWEQQGVVNIDPADKGRIRRFNRLESIWLSIVTEARKFGLPLENLKQARKDLLNSPMNNFSLLKFCVLNSILLKPKIITISGEGHVGHYSVDLYQKFVADRIFPMHLSFNLLDFIKSEYPRNCFDSDFKIDDPFNDFSKLLFLYFLKTGDFEQIRLYVNAVDVRLIDSPENILKNPELLKILKKWNFYKAEVIVDNEVETVITVSNVDR